MTKISTKRVVLVSFIVDCIDIVTNFMVAAITGSAVIFAETIQGIVDSIGSFLLLVGYRRSNRPSDTTHPFGYTREVFFWALLSSMLMFFFGSGLTIRRGIDQLRNAEVIQYPWLALTVLIISVLTNGYAFYQSFSKLRVSGQSFFRSFSESSQPLVKTALLRDSLGTLSAIIGLCSLLLYLYAGIAVFDGLGAIVIGVMMGGFSILLIKQTQHLITGQSVSKDIRRKILRSAKRIPQIHTVNRLTAVYTGSEDILVDLDLELADNLTTTKIEKVLDTVKEEIIKDVPEAKNVQIDLNSSTIQEEVKIKKSN